MSSLVKTRGRSGILSKDAGHRFAWSNRGDPREFRGALAQERAEPTRFGGGRGYPYVLVTRSGGALSSLSVPFRSMGWMTSQRRHARRCRGGDGKGHDRDLGPEREGGVRVCAAHRGFRGLVADTPGSFEASAHLSTSGLAVEKVTAGGSFTLTTPRFLPAAPDPNGGRGANACREA